MKGGPKVHIQNHQRLVSIHPRRLRSVAEKVLKQFRPKRQIHLNILLLDDLKMAELHKRFLGKEGPTDVLAFGMQEGKVLKGDPFLLGDIAISTETACRQAKHFHSDAEREVILYVIHGILHLFGYDDHRELARLKMRQKERELLKLFQI